ncbi:MAG: glycosyltransferase family 2 protein [Cyclobacteriaceae bacterium]|nr:glycosyltransferase family 2 protein [Cyclobacteriaceae bacterium]
MTQISAVIITKNEENNIGRCLKSLEGVADEIIVVDSFSEDQTEAICSNYGVRFVQKVFIDYSDQKNYANSLAGNEFILSIDADEELSPELRNSILSQKNTLEADGYQFNRKTNYCGAWINHCGWYPDTKLRLFKKSKAEWKGSIHEELILSSQHIIHLKGDILHYSFPDIESHLRKMNHFTDYMAQNMYNKNKKVSLLKLIISPGFEFIKKYILQLGFLDGYQGFIISKMAAHYKFYKFAKLREKYNFRKSDT